jgi:hypothetical protein
MTGNEILAEIRRLLYEASADLWTDADLIAHANAEIRLLPFKGIFLEELWTTSKVADQQDYAVPSDTFKIELLEENTGTTDNPSWEEMKGYDFYAGALWLSSMPSDTHTIRAWISKAFSAIAANNTESDIPETKIDIVIYGAAIRAYQQLVGYIVDSKNYDSNIKPDGISLSNVRGWIVELEAHQKRMLEVIRGIPRPRQINMVE